MKGYQGLLTAAVLVLAGCGGGDKTIVADRQGAAVDKNATVLLKSSAAWDVNCTLIGGTLALTRQLDGASVGTCQLANGKRCDKSAVMNGTCPAG